MTPPKNILIVRTDKIGDIVLTLPLAKIIKSKYPNCRITFLVKEYTFALVKDHPFIDEVLLLKETNKSVNLSGNIEEIRKRDFDYCFIVHPTFKIALSIFLSKIQFRVGSGYRWYSFLFNRKIYEHRKYGKMHELQHNINLLNEIDVFLTALPENVSFDIQVDDNSRQKVEKTLFAKGYNTSKKTIIIHPGSFGSAIDLPFDMMRELTNLVAQELDVNILITGSQAETELCNKLVLYNCAINLAGEFNLSELTSLISKCDVLVANSTGPIHIAAALGKHVVGFYPKIPACSPKRWEPFTNKKDIFLPTINCENCTPEKCKKSNCMSSINIDEVFKSIAKIVKEG